MNVESVNHYQLHITGYDRDNRHMSIKLRAYPFNPIDKLNVDFIAKKAKSLGIARAWVTIKRRGVTVNNDRLY